jgi:hypothetical protein
MVTVTVGVGTNGLLTAIADGFTREISHTESFTMAYHNLMTFDPVTQFANSCPTGTTLMNLNYGTGCCFNNDVTQCMGGGYHTDFLYRGVAFGDGKFVAVGGWGFGIATVSNDGGQTWQSRQAFTKGNSFTTGTNSEAAWFAGITYGKGRFVAVDGGGTLFWSTDGRNWTSTSGSCRDKPGSGALRSIYFTGDAFYASGDNGTWGLSTDGSSWSQTGVGNGVQSLVRLNNMYYGIYDSKVWATSQLTNPWTELASVGTADQLVYRPDTKQLVAIGAHNHISSVAPFTTWVVNSYNNGPYRSISMLGNIFIGALARSNDGLTWQNLTGLTPSDNPIVGTFASGEVPASWIKSH